MTVPSTRPGPERLSLIAAIARNGVIGRDNDLPWHLPGDLPRFKRVTMGHPLIMGRKNHESIGRPLPGRRNLVLTRQSDWTQEGVEVFHSLDDALAACADEAEAFVIGGAELYRQALPLADRLHLTRIEKDYEGDVVFPEVDWSAFERLSVEHHEGPPPHQVEVWHRLRK